VTRVFSQKLIRAYLTSAG